MTVKEIFETMDYGPAPESSKEALAWLASKGDFGHFIGGAWTAPGTLFAVMNPATDTLLAQVTQGTQADVDAAVKAARKAQPAWAKDGHARAKVLYALATCRPAPK
ncbi:MAG: aldehyde dehydrogenase family protein [Alphaproteobacteria bacterium]|nr:aldehyde dehydrogenase family protein [Alphaproteobacteria bacterium]